MSFGEAGRSFWRGFASLLPMRRLACAEAHWHAEAFIGRWAARMAVATIERRRRESASNCLVLRTIAEIGDCSHSGHWPPERMDRNNPGEQRHDCPGCGRTIYFWLEPI